MRDRAHDATLWSPGYAAATFAILTVVALAAFDGLAITAAFPSITEELGSVSLAPWIFTGFLAASAIAVIVGGPVIDAVGVRRTFRLLSTWFLLASTACALAPSMALLVAARVVQGAAAGILTAVGLAAIGLTYPDRLRPRAFAASSAVWGAMGFGGPALGALALGAGGWRIVFLAQLPLTALAMVAGWNALPSTRERPQPIVYDRRGIGLLTVVVIASLVGFDQVIARWAWAVVAAGVIAVAVAAYVRHARTAPAPVLSLDHLTREPLRDLHLVAVCVLAAGLAASNYLPLYMEIVHGTSPERAAFTVLFLTIGWTAGAAISSRLLDRFPAPAVIIVGASAHAPSLLLSAWTVWIEAPLGLVFAAFLLTGLTIGTVSTPVLSMLQRHSDEAEMGRVNSAHQFLRGSAVTVGVAIGSAVLFGVVNHQLGEVEIVRDALEGDAVAAGASTVDAVRDGFTWALVAASVVGTGAAAAAGHLRRAARTADYGTARRIDQN